MSGKMIAIAASVCALGVSGLGVAAFAQQTQAPSMPPDLANMAQSARAWRKRRSRPKVQIQIHLPDHDNCLNTRLPVNSSCQRTGAHGFMSDRH